MKNTKLKLFLLSILSGVLFWIAWPMNSVFPFIFVTWVPLLFVEDIISKTYHKTGRKVFLYSLITFLAWNALTTWWVCNASLAGGIFAIIGNSLLFTIPFILFHHTKKVIGERIGMFSLMAFWIGFEYLHLNWELTWPWLTLGNVFAKFPEVVQWYEYTGVLGGSLWILFVNSAIYTAIKSYSQIKFRVLMRPMFLIIFPLAISYSLIPQTSLITNLPKGTEVVVVQPNIDTYTQKFTYNARTGESNNETFMAYDEQLQILMDESSKLITPKTKYLFWPETSVPKGHWEESLESNTMIRKIQEFVKSYNGLTLVTGADTYIGYESKEVASVSARYEPSVGYYDAFNTALEVNEKGNLAVYHKSKLVPGTVRMPYPGIFGFLDYFAIDLGGIVGSLGTQSERTVFYNENKMSVAPVVCYESIFGEFVGEFVENGAQFITIITNDNWWDDTPGYKHHFEYARLRAVEHRKDIARAANTGISGFIYSDGTVGKTLGWDIRGGVRGNVHLNETKTYYTLHGDYIGRIASFIAIAFLFSIIVKRITTKKK